MPLDVGRPLANAVRVAAEIAAAAWEPPPPIDYTAWAEKNVVFGNESPKPGPYDRRYHPWDVLIHQALAPEHWARTVVLIGSAQTIGKTTTAQIFVGGSQDMDPGPLIYYHPTENNALKWVKTKWKAFVRGTPCLGRIFPTGRSRDSSNSLLFQERVDGRGWIQSSGANSESSLSQISSARQVQDDLAKWELNTAGDPELQADSRSEAFPWAKVLKIGTALISPGCRMTRAYKRSVQAEVAVPCPHCDHYQPLRWENFKVSVDAIKDARKAGTPEAAPHFTCMECGVAIEQRHRAEIVTPEKIREHFTNWDEGRRLAVYGLRVWSAYSPQKSWADIAEGWLAAEGDPKREQTFYNDVLGLDYVVAGAAPPWEKIRERAEALKAPLGRIPVGGIILTAGVDCQRDRCEAHIKAFGRDGRRYTVEYIVIDGHISEDKAKAALDALLKHTWRDSFGNRRPLDMLAIDGNYATEDVHDWAKRYPQDRVIMVRGVRGDAAPAMTLVKNAERKADGQTVSYQRRFWNVGVSALKAALYKALDKTDPIAKGFCGYPAGLNEEFFKQLCAEQRIVVKIRGATEWRWVQIEGQANEVLDTEMYAEAAARRLGWKRFTDKDWDRLTAEREQPAPDRQLDLEEPDLIARGPKPQEPAAAHAVRAESDHDIEAPQAGPDDRGGVRSGISRPGYLRRR
jgi:phage terminase large subunit GpA-like protein